METDEWGIAWTEPQTRRQLIVRTWRENAETFMYGHLARLCDWAAFGLALWWEAGRPSWNGGCARRTSHIFLLSNRFRIFSWGFTDFFLSLIFFFPGPSSQPSFPQHKQNKTQKPTKPTEYLVVLNATALIRTAIN